MDVVDRQRLGGRTGTFCHLASFCRKWLRLTPLTPVRVALRVPKRHGIVLALPSRLGLPELASFGGADGHSRRFVSDFYCETNPKRTRNAGIGNT